jgi:hypothetical protein
MTDDTTLINPSIPKYKAPVLEEGPLSNNVTQVVTSARLSGKAKNYPIQKIRESLVRDYISKPKPNSFFQKIISIFKD